MDGMFRVLGLRVLGALGALASDECSKALIYESWQGVAAFTNVYGCTAELFVYQSDWSASVCTEP